MATTTRPYLVVNTATQEKRLVQASNQAQARNYVARNQYSVEVASGNDVIELMQSGVKPEVATGEEKDSGDAE